MLKHSTSKKNIPFRFQWVLFLCFWLWTITGLFFPQAAFADAPVAVDDAYTTDEDAAHTVAAPGVLGNDSDVDGDALTAVLGVGPSSGTLVLNADGSFAYTPNLNFNGSDSFTYTLNDGVLDSSIAAVTITVNAVNDAPTAEGQTVTTAEATAVTITLTGSDVDGDVLSFSVVAGPMHGTLSGAAPDLTYTPNTDFNGADSFTYHANDGTVNSSTATVTITVSAVNDAPVAVDDAYTTDEDAAHTVAAPGVLGNDSDEDGDALTAVLGVGPSSGTLVLNADGSFAYTPNLNFNGSDSFTYTLNDGVLDSRIATVTITVNAVNDAPTANADAITVDEGETVSVLNSAQSSVLANDSDAEGDGLTAVLASGPNHAVDFSLNADGSFSYTHDGSKKILDSFTYLAADASRESTEATVTIRINPRITIIWNRSLENDLAGYKLYYKIGSPVVDKEDPDLIVIEIPKESLADEDKPAYTLKGLDATQVYFFAVTAYDDKDPVHESDFSNGESTLKITKPEETFFVSRKKYAKFKTEGQAIPGTKVEVFANDIPVEKEDDKKNNDAVNDAGGWKKYLDFTGVSEGEIELTVVYNGIASFPVKGILDITPPLIELSDPAPAVKDKKDSYAIIEWVTNEPAFGSVAYGLDENYGNIKTSEVLTKNHHFIITGLTAETQYHFRVSAEDAAGNGPDSSATDKNPSPDYSFTTDAPTPPSIVKYPEIGTHYIEITFDKLDVQNADLETNYTFSPSLIFRTPEDPTDSVFKIDDFSYILLMQFIPAYEVLKLTVSGITDSAGQPVTPATIMINDNDNDEMADDWETEYGLNPEQDDNSQDRDGDGYSNYQEYLARTHPRRAASLPFRIIDTIPQNGAGVSETTRVPNDSSVAVLIESTHGIEITGEDAIRFTIDDGHHLPYERNLSSDTVRLVKLRDEDTLATFIWVAYDRSLETYIPEQVYPFDSEVNITVEARDVYNNSLNPARVVFKVESQQVYMTAQENLPRTADFVPEEPGYDAGVEVTGGDLEGAMIFYDSREPMTPSFGPMSNIQPPVVFNGDAAVGVPANLVPHTVFDTPVKIFMPCPGVADVSNLRLYYFNGMEWQLASDADGNVLFGGEGWMVPGSRVNHTDMNPPMIELRVYHFSAAQAVGVVSPPPGGSSASTAAAGSSGGGGGGCFIGSAKHSGLLGFLSSLGILSLLGLLSLLSLMGFLGLLARFIPLLSSSTKN